MSVDIWILNGERIADGYVQGKLFAVSLPLARLLCRIQGSGDPSRVSFGPVSSGHATLIGDSVLDIYQSLAPGSIWRMEFLGNTITGFIDGVNIGTVVSSLGIGWCGFQLVTGPVVRRLPYSWSILNDVTQSLDYSWRILESLSIGYTTQQMTTGGTPQTLTVSGGAGPYTWSIVSGGGSLDPGTGDSTIYTPPSSNANCLNNPTIRVTDIYGSYAELKIAVSNPSVSGTAVKRVLRQGTPHPGGCGVGTPCPDCPSIIQQSLTCTGSISTQPYCVQSYGRGLGRFSPYDWHCCMEYAGDCTDASWATLEAACNCVYLEDNPYNCTERYVDVRTAQMKTDGCCPAGLL